MKTAFLLLSFKTSYFRLSRQRVWLICFMPNIFIFIIYFSWSVHSLSCLFNLASLKPTSYSETIILCVLGKFSHSHKFIMKLDNMIAWQIGLCFLKRFMMFNMTQVVNTTSQWPQVIHVVLQLLSTLGKHGFCRARFSR